MTAALLLDVRNLTDVHLTTSSISQHVWRRFLSTICDIGKNNAPVKSNGKKSQQ